MKKIVYLFVVIFFFTAPLSQALDISDEDRTALALLKSGRKIIQETAESGISSRETSPPFKNRLSEIERHQNPSHSITPEQVMSACVFDFPELRRREAALTKTILSLTAFNNGPLNRRKNAGSGLRIRSREELQRATIYFTGLDTRVQSLYPRLEPLRRVFINYFNQLNALHTFVYLGRDHNAQQQRFTADIQSPELQAWFEEKLVEPSKTHIKETQGNILTNYIRIMEFAETAYCLLEKGSYLWYQMLGLYAKKYGELGDSSLIETYKKIKFKPSSSEEK